MASSAQQTWVWVDSGVGDGQGGLACCGSWGHKESDTTEQLKNNNNNKIIELRGVSTVLLPLVEKKAPEVWVELDAAPTLDGRNMIAMLSPVKGK